MNSSFENWTHTQKREAWNALIATLDHTGPRYKVVVMQAHYLNGYFFGMQWYVVDCANNFRPIWSTPDVGGPCDAYHYAARRNDEDQRECERLNAIRLNGLY